LQSEEQELLRELLNLSQLTITPTPAAPEDIQSAIFETSPADGTKCERCWHYEISVGENEQHPTLCSRCLQAVQ